MQRRLAAILAADVVGYSRLMEADEANTLARLKSIRADLIDPKIANHNGRIVKLMGDGALVEFFSIRVNAQLIDAQTGGHVWADRFDGDVADVFAVQDAFVSKIVGALEVSLTTEEQQEMGRDKTGSIAAKEAFDVGWSHYLQFNAKDNAAAVSPLMRALDLDPSMDVLMPRSHSSISGPLVPGGPRGAGNWT